ncbi:MAG: hypothetical protein A3J51_03075 [Omnitrophica WOR_2 bacterium RIFCSPHIGHO2_02_FULL_45_21]|nr:MAG: hypothetical protein A3J51_03075 [Omnitrophica WOR_2 bacterium RIFCSPHIGHO2_02_FULL_45_21]
MWLPGYDMRVVIVDPLLKNLSGHCYFYDKAAIAELQKRNIPFLLFGNTHADKDCLAIDNFFPCSTDIISSVFAAAGPIKKLFNVLRASRLFKQQLENCLFKNPDFYIKENDSIFIPTFYIFELIFLGWIFALRSKQFAQIYFRLNIILRFRYIRNSKILTALLGFFYKLACNVFLGRLKDKVVYLTDSELLKKEYEALLNREVLLCPIPLNPFVFKIGKESDASQKNIPNGRIVISYVGGARYNKGFDTFVDMAIRLNSDKELSEKIFFVLQLDIHPQRGKDRKIVCSAVEKIESFSERVDNIRIVRGTLPMQKYYRLLSESQIIVLPYRDEAYKSATANILVETILLGKVPVVSSNTWMAYELSKFGLKELVFEIGSTLNLAQTIKKIALGYSYYLEKIRWAQPCWKEFHSVCNLVDLLVPKSKALDALQ